MSVFTDAIRVLEERGWHQGGAVGNGGAVCMGWAFTVATRRQSLSIEKHCRLWQRVAEASRELFDTTPYRLNDAPTTTLPDVVRVFERAHELAEAE